MNRNTRIPYCDPTELRIACYLFISTVIVACLTIIFIESKKMNNQQKGSFHAHDNNGHDIVVEWHMTNMMSADFAHFMKSVWNFARDAYMPVEMDFLKDFPEVVGKDPYFAPFETLFIGKKLTEID